MEVTQVANVLFQQFIVLQVHRMEMDYFGLVLILVQFISYFIRLNMIFVGNLNNIVGLKMIYQK